MLVTIEGLDGVGKSTLIEGLYRHFNHGRLFANIRRMAEPWTIHPKNFPDGEDEHKDLLSRFYGARSKAADPRGIGVLAFMLLDRFSHIKHMRRALSQPNTLYIVDRYIDSSTAYQSVSITEGQFASMGAASNMDEYDFLLEDWVEYLDAFQKTLFPVPNLTLYLDGGVEVIQRKARDSREQLGFKREHTAKMVSRAYDAIHDLSTNKDRVVKVDARGTVDQVLEEAAQIVQERIDGYVPSQQAEEDE